MAFTKKTSPVADAKPVDEPVVEEVEAADAKAEVDSKASKTVGSQFLELISRDEAGNDIKAMQIGQRGVIVVCGLTSVYVPGADIVDRGQGKQIV